MTFGDGDWRAGREASRAVLDRYLEVGGNSIDTADVYGGGRSEELLGEFLADSRLRESLVLGTKASAPARVGDPNSRGNGRKHLLAALDRSLRRLRTDYVDLFWVHLWDGATPVREVMSTLDGLVVSGKVRAVGLSNVPAWYATAAALIAGQHGWEPPAALQLEYSLLERTIEREHTGAASFTGMSVVGWSPLANGVLTGKYNPDETPGHGGRLDPSRNYPDQRPPTEHAWEVLAVVRRVAAELDSTPARVAIAWALGRPTIASVIVGATTPSQLDDNLAAVDLALTQDAWERLDAVSALGPATPYRLFTAR